MNKTITIRVTEECISKGCPGFGTSCPITYAAQEAGLELPYASVRGLFADDFEADLPRSAQRFIRAFDAGKPVKPFAFRVRRQG